MALNKTGLRSEIDTLLNALLVFDGSSGQTQAEAINKFKNDLADAIDTFVKTAKVTVPGTGLVAPSGGGPVTGTSTTGNLS
ncbi:MAG: hypothetical protein ACUZ8E_09625 [Candidatus Anammoxibacter sp.]